VIVCGLVYTGYRHVDAMFFAPVDVSDTGVVEFEVSSGSSLSSVSRKLEEAGAAFIRYADDLVVFASSPAQLQQAMALARDRERAERMRSAQRENIDPEAAEKINNRKGRIIAVGTTSCRTLESAADENGIIHPVSGDTGIFIYPGYKFKAIDALITNFHLPESTLLMLVSALSSREIMLNAYNEAIREKYRFFSYGDAMFIH